MKKSRKFYVIWIMVFLVLLTVCQATSEEQTSLATTKPPSESEMQEEIGSVTENFEIVQDSEEEPVELKDTEEQSREEIAAINLDFLNDAFIISVYKDSKGNQRVLTLKDGVLQLWINQKIACEKEIPIPAELAIGDGFYSTIGNPYISEDGRLVLLQSYTTPEGKLKLDYTILENSCRKIIPTLAYNGFVFQNSAGKYGFAFYNDYSYAGTEFFITYDRNFVLPKPIIIWLNDSTVKSVKFGTWGTTSYGYQDITAISARLDVENYGDLDISLVQGPFEAVEVDDDFFGAISVKFTPQEYKKELTKVIQLINQYKQRAKTE